MGRYFLGRKGRASSGRKLPRRIVLLPLALIVIAVIGAIVVHQKYTSDLKPVSRDQQTQIYTVPEGSSVKQIAAGLQDKMLIRSAWAFELYVHSKDLTDKMQAGTYAVSPSETTAQIVATMTHGRVASRLVTILPGRRIDQIRADLINDGFSPTDVDQSLVPSQYSDLPVLSYKPASVNSLEGLLWPDSYQKEQGTSAAVIVREALVDMGEHLTPDVQQAFAAEGLTTYQGLTLTSVVLQEVNKPTDQAQAAQVFLLRMKNGMVLGSDVTANYGSIAAGQTPNLSYDSPYNTLIHPGLPPSPISTISTSSLSAATHPATTDWLYFVAGDDGTTYFSHTYEEHQAATAKYCHKLCGQ